MNYFYTINTLTTEEYFKNIKATNIGLTFFLKEINTKEYFDIFPIIT